jgi:hypothetical protein
MTKDEIKRLILDILEDVSEESWYYSDDGETFEDGMRRGINGVREKLDSTPPATKDDDANT